MEFLSRLKWLAIFGALGVIGLHQAVGSAMTSEQPPEAVLAALADLDIRKQPGEPGSTAEASGGILPEFMMTRDDNRIIWTVMSGDQVATTMTATVSENWMGKTSIETHVERGDAPDQVTSPAFRSESMTQALFKNAISDQLALIGSVGWGPECNELRDEIVHGEGGVMENPLKLATFQGELRDLGCDVNAEPKGFKHVTETSGPDPEYSEEEPSDDRGPVQPQAGDNVSRFQKVSPY